MRADVQRIQRQLIALQLLAAGEDDGLFGQNTLAAANRLLAMRQLPPLEPPYTPSSIAGLTRVLFPEDAAKPSPVQNWLIGLAIKQAINALKGSTMSATLAGYKTYIVAALIIVIAVLEALGIQVPFVSSSAPELITYALGLIFARNGAKTEVSKVIGK